MSWVSKHIIAMYSTVDWLNVVSVERIIFVLVYAAFVHLCSRTEAPRPSKLNVYDKHWVCGFSGSLTFTLIMQLHLNVLGLTI